MIPFCSSAHRLRLLCVVLLIVAASGLGQESRGTITGHVSDVTGAGLPDAAVLIVNTQTQTEFHAKTNDAGLFTVPFLVPGTYNVSVEHPGFKKLTRNNVQLQVDDTVALNLPMVLGDVAQSVEVTGAAPLLQTADSSLGQVVDSHQMVELPNPSGNPAEFVTLTPGVTNLSIAVHKAAFNSGTSSFMVNGNTSQSNEFAIDGVPNTFASGTAPRIAFSAPQSAISEFKVMTTFYDAAMGHTPGAIINVTTTSGTNQFHGELHEYFGASALNANDFFSNLSGQKKTVWRDNRYGGAISGPVYIPKVYDGRNKTFFSYVYEGNKWGVPYILTMTVPTAAERTGDLSALMKLGSQYQIYDPYSTVAAGNGQYVRTPVPGNIIPASKLNPVSLNIANYWANPTLPGRADGTNNDVLTTASSENYHVNFLRIDHYFSDRDRAFLRIDQDWWQESKADSWEYNNLSTGLYLHRINRGLALDNVFVMSASSILDLRYGLTQQEFPENRRSAGFDLSSLGYSPSLTSLVSNPALATFPYMSFTSFSGFGNWETGDGTNTGLVHDVNGTVSSLHGAHSLRFGGDFRNYRAFQNRYPYDVSPVLTFNGSYTNAASNATTAPIGQDLASFLYGIPTGGSMQRTASYADQELFFAAFFQDDWKVNSKLTLNLGMRIEHETPITERFNRAIQGFEGTATNPIAATALANYAAHPVSGIPLSAFQVLGGLNFVGGANGRDLWSGQAMEYLPRIGLAYQVAPKTVIRAGYGIFYDTLGTNRSPAIQTGFTAATPLVTTYNNGLDYSATMANPFPNGLISPTGSSLGLATALGQNLTVYPKNRLQPYAQRWSFDLEQQLPGAFLVDLSYVGNHSVRLPIVRQLNATPNAFLSTSNVRDQATINYLTAAFPSPFAGINSTYTSTISRATLLEPFPEFGTIGETESLGYSNYESLQVQVTKRFTQGYLLKGSYTFSKLMDATAFLNSGDLNPWYGISTYDRPNILTIDGVWELPFGKGHALASTLPAWANAAVGGWELAGSIVSQSGDPLTWGNIIFNGNINDINLSGSERSVSRWFNTSAGFVTSSSAQLADNVRTFPLRFAGVRGPGIVQVNMSVSKSFPIHERLNLVLRGDAFNALNHANFTDPNLTVTSGGFGQITNINGYSREVQVSAKLRF
ncbi:MAG TPA: carboxypeptidase regulatory-like domain-containing protein [Bryobacteraceae bacterium]